MVLFISFYLKLYHAPPFIQQTTEALYNVPRIGIFYYVITLSNQTTILYIRIMYLYPKLTGIILNKIPLSISIFSSNMKFADQYVNRNNLLNLEIPYSLNLEIKGHQTFNRCLETRE